MQNGIDSRAHRGTARSPKPVWPFMARVEVQNFALVTHAVPLERVRPHVPGRLQLDTVSIAGVDTALITTGCFCNHRLHWAPLRHPAMDFNQITFRTYVLHRGEAGAYFLGTFVDTAASFAVHKALSRPSYRAEIETSIDGGDQGYGSYSCSATSAAGEVSFHLEARDRPTAQEPFSSGDALAQFITHRLHGFSPSPTGLHAYGSVAHRRLRPWSGTLASGRFDFWARLGILLPEEMPDAYSVLVEPSVTFTLLPPRLTRL